MEIKKSPAADLEPHRTTRLLMGFVVALAVLFVALEWTEQDDIDSMDALLSDLVFEEELEVPLVEHPIVPFPVPAKPLPVVEDKPTVVENDVAEDSPVEFSAEPLGSGGEERIEEDVYEAISLETCVARRISAGGTGPDSVRAQLESVSLYPRFQI